MNEDVFPIEIREFASVMLIFPGCKVHVSNELNPGWLGCVRDYNTTQLYRDCNTPLLGSLSTNQYNGK